MHAKQQKNMPTCKELIQEFTTIANTPTRTNKQIEPQTKPVQTPTTQNTINSERRSITQASTGCRGNITRVSPRYQSKSEPRTLRQPSPHPRHARLPGLETQTDGCTDQVLGDHPESTRIWMNVVVCRKRFVRGLS